MAAGLARLEGLEVVPEETAVGESQGNDLAEHAIREVTEKVRTWKTQVEEFRKVELGVDHFIFFLGRWSSQRLSTLAQGARWSDCNVSLRSL